MYYDVNEKEFSNVTNLSSNKRYEYFIKKVCDWEQIWSIKSNEGYVLMGDDLGREAIPFWPAKRYAEVFCRKEWRDCRPEVIALNVFLEKWIPGMEKDELPAAIFPISSNKGMVLELSELEKDINYELDKFE